MAPGTIKVAFGALSGSSWELFLALRSHYFTTCDRLYAENLKRLERYSDDRSSGAYRRKKATVERGCMGFSNTSGRRATFPAIQGCSSAIHCIR